MTTIPPQPAGDPERYRGLPDTAHFALDERRELLVAPLTGVARVAPAFCVRLLQCCRTFAPLEEHARSIAAEFKLPAHEIGPLREHLATLAADGILVSHRQALDRLGTADVEEPPRITTVGVPTRARTASLEQCLTALLTAPRNGPPPELVVVDDSGRPEVRDANRALLTALRERHGRAISYAGPRERSHFARQLADHLGLEPDVASFALVNDESCPVATGTGRNLLLLHTVGEALLQVDDDVIARLAPAPGARPGLVLSSRQDPREFWFPPEGIPADAFVTSDLLAVHEQLLGKHSGDWAGNFADGSSLDFEGAGASFFRRLGNVGGRVRVTAAGTAGDSGMTSPLYYLLFEEASRERLHQSEEVYRQTVTRQRAVCAVTRATVTEGTLCMGLNLGLDNRWLLPPFMPVQRNQDGVFGTLVKACCPGAFFGYLPWLVRHEPPQPRNAGPEAAAQALSGVRSDRVLQLLIRDLAPAIGGSEDRNLRVLGEALAQLGAAPAREFEEVVRLRVWADVSRVASRLAAQMQQFGGEPAWWAADVRRLLEVVHGRLPQADFAVPEDLRRAFGPDAAPAVFRRLVHRFGRLLAAWPSLVAAARELRGRGIRPATPV